ncbi:hypothetical protein J6352_23090 [Burkholderia pseudomallei]|uniref:hypothetical protein n=1 Tax=Burkholderia pseudomallei TaxID=28450 RepID=UPI00193E7880|nr:hypothetical protein [Burkholderia pseudomallei]MBO7752745.1 hypothetical protein [Burkholderia pseudomallei]MBO7775481.1 hypothetical protein [Burkholderia pseudomallei]MBO7804313.1 hypothetical protein [Burkholderia pseudomallei]MBO7908273.1 hypothetical protein [Burkholderia pseudomallei]MBO7931996.1 hypothetical protein [Burkholderia pseudomallei]
MLLAEAVANRPADIDVVLINGYGFPRWQGGPLYWPMARGARARHGAPSACHGARVQNGRFVRLSQGLTASDPKIRHPACGRDDTGH